LAAPAPAPRDDANDFRLTFCHDLTHQRSIADITNMTLHATLPSASNKSGERRQRQTSHCRAHTQQPECQPCALKPVCPVSKTRRPCQKLGSGAGKIVPD
jgi:hypothetical protein